MKLLFDQNLSRVLVAQLADLFPASMHVKDVGLAEVDDDIVWRFAKEQGFAIVSKDADFQQRSVLLGAPPKVIWLKVGNCPTARIEKLIRDHSVSFHTFDADPVQSFLILS